MVPKHCLRLLDLNQSLAAALAEEQGSESEEIFHWMASDWRVASVRLSQGAAPIMLMTLNTEGRLNGMLMVHQGTYLAPQHYIVVGHPADINNDDRSRSVRPDWAVSLYAGQRGALIRQMEPREKNTGTISFSNGSFLAMSLCRGEWRLRAAQPFQRGWAAFCPERLN